MNYIFHFTFMHIFRTIMRLIAGTLILSSLMFITIDQILSLGPEVAFLYKVGYLAGFYGLYQMHMAFRDFRKIHKTNKFLYWIASITPISFFIYSSYSTLTEPTSILIYSNLGIACILVCGHTFDFFHYKKPLTHTQEIDGILDL